VVLTAIADTLYTMLAKKTPRLRGLGDAPKLYRHFVPRERGSVSVRGDTVTVSYPRHAPQPQFLRAVAWNKPPGHLARVQWRKSYPSRSVTRGPANPIPLSFSKFGWMKMAD